MHCLNFTMLYVDGPLFQDVYIMMSMTVLVLVCIWHAIIPQIAADWGLGVAHTSDMIVLVVLGSIFVILHIVFGFWIAARVRTSLLILIAVKRYRF